MEEKNIKDTALDIATAINQGFSEHSLLPKWPTYTAVSKFKSVRRAIKRGHVDLFFGIVYPRRPYNNRKPTAGRAHNELKKRIYGQLQLQ